MVAQSTNRLNIKDSIWVLKRAIKENRRIEKKEDGGIHYNGKLYLFTNEYFKQSLKLKVNNRKVVIGIKDTLSRKELRNCLEKHRISVLNFTHVNRNSTDSVKVSLFHSVDNVLNDFLLTRKSNRWKIKFIDSLIF
ncbi:MAG: hypothetical protein KA313_05695 [Pseudarcicella sp.]|nr:hypothetical protein [Pseudarcicella sp.]MBP6410574.1 hypothetical protein [Pseudarcicella sp.]